MLLIRSSTLSTATSKLGALWYSALRNTTLGLCLLCLGHHLCLLRLLFILGLLDPLFNLTEISKVNKTQIELLKIIH